MTGVSGQALAAGVLQRWKTNGVCANGPNRSPVRENRIRNRRRAGTRV